MQPLLSDWEANSVIIASINHAIKAVDEFDPVLYAEVKRERIKRRHQKNHENRI